MPGAVVVKKSSEITSPSGPQSDGMERIPAIVNMSDQICGTGTYLLWGSICAKVCSDACETPQRQCNPPSWRRRYDCI